MKYQCITILKEKRSLMLNSIYAFDEQECIVLPESLAINIIEQIVTSIVPYYLTLQQNNLERQHQREQELLNDHMEIERELLDNNTRIERILLNG
jgi:hypothetical protein